MDIWAWIQENKTIVLGIAAVLLVVFKNNPIIARILQFFIDTLTPKAVSVVTHDDAVKHYMALAECCKDCPESKKPLDELWVHIKPTIKG